MPDLYAELGVNRSADNNEIKSAYRRLARQYHPDVNPDPASAQRFARLNEAYHILSDPSRRTWYDQMGSTNGINLVGQQRTSIESMRVARRAYYQARADRIVNDWLERERLETKARGKAVYTVVTLFMTTFIMAMTKPNLFATAGWGWRLVLTALFLLGVWHLFKSLKEHFDYYTYTPPRRSRKNKPPEKKFKRGIAWAFVIGGYVISLCAGLLLDSLTDFSTELFGTTDGEDAMFAVMFYPPIAVLIVDMIYQINLRLEEF